MSKLLLILRCFFSFDWHRAYKCKNTLQSASYYKHWSLTWHYSFPPAVSAFLFSLSEFLSTKLLIMKIIKEALPKVIFNLCLFSHGYSMGEWNHLDWAVNTWPTSHSPNFQSVSVCIILSYMVHSHLMLSFLSSPWKSQTFSHTHTKKHNTFCPWLCVCAYPCLGSKLLWCILLTAIKNCTRQWMTDKLDILAASLDTLWNWHCICYQDGVGYLLPGGMSPAN